MPETHSAWVVAAGSLLVFIGLAGKYYAVPQIVHSIVTEKVVLNEGSEALERFMKTPQPLHFHVYLFHVENPEEVSTNGARPVLSEKGPYVYDMYKERVDLQFHKEDDTLSYFGKSTYFFNKEKSGCRSENDIVTVIHAPILGTALKLQLVSSMGLGIFNDAVPLLFKAKNIFLTASVRELLFSGIYINCSYPEDSFPAGAICQGLRLRAPRTYRRDGTDFYFSMFNHLNGTSTERVRVSKGPSDVGTIRTLGGNATLSTWRQGTPCNLINGTDGTIFAPFQQDTRVLPIYTAGSCRSLYLFYDGDTDLLGVPAMRFTIDENMLSSGRDYSPNRCFCVIPPEPDQQSEVDEEDEANGRRRRDAEAPIEVKELEACLPKGAMDLSKCSGSPIILTFPHFYLGASQFLEYPIGLSPNRNDHQTIVDIEPVTGIPLRAKKRIQLNMFLKRIEDFNYLSSVSEGLFPILWIEEGITLEGPSMDKIITANSGLKVLYSLPWAATGLGSFLIIGGAAYLTGIAQIVTKILRSKRPKVQQTEELPAVSPPEAPPYRMAVGFGPDDSLFGQKAQMAANGRGSLSSEFIMPINQNTISSAYPSNLHLRLNKI